MVLPVLAAETASLSSAFLDRLGLDVGVDLAELLAAQTFAAEPGDTLVWPLATAAPRLLVIVGAGQGDAVGWRKAGAATARRVADCAVVGLAAEAILGDDALTALTEGLVLASYRFRADGAAPKGPKVQRFELLGDDDPSRQAVLNRALAGTRATLRARDLTNTPSMLKTPQWLADQAAVLAGPAGLKVRVRDEQALAADGFGGILAVGRGSTRPPRLIELSYTPKGATRHVVLIGKGITFDSGGLSLKPNDSMVSMKTDMAGGAAVIAVMAELAASEVAVRVTGLVPAAENLPSGTAQRPGDVIRHYGGRTSEVLNTDAEGRLVLADALAYADARLEPDVIVDIATLTGAAPLGLGRRHGALYATSDALAAGLAAAASQTGERLWRMPLVSDYRFAIDSRIADVANTATDHKISGGSILAALFLQEFTGGRTWAHLDVAGPARADGDEDEITKGATGFGARLLLRWLQDQRWL
ncbi:MAG: leucyl aminopeptidase family protein, partial [Frankiaceae bacterium]